MSMMYENAGDDSWPNYIICLYICILYRQTCDVKDDGDDDVGGGTGGFQNKD